MPVSYFLMVKNSIIYPLAIQCIAWAVDSFQVGVGRVSFSALGMGFGFLDFARVGFRVKLGSNFFAFFSQFWLYLATN